MSIEAIARAYACPASLTNSQAFMLVTLADFANRDWTCWPKMKTIAARTRQSINTARKRIDELVAAGLVYRFQRKHDDNTDSSNGFVLLLDPVGLAYAADHGWQPALPRPKTTGDAVQLTFDLDGFTPSPDARKAAAPPVYPAGASVRPARPSTSLEGEGPTGWRGRVQLAGPQEPSLEPPREPSPPNPLRGHGAGDDLPVEKKDLWPAFEAAYPWSATEPRHPAKRQFARLSAAEQDLAIRHAADYGADCRSRTRKICFAKTWLRDRGWEPFAALPPAVATAAPPRAPMVWIAKDTPAWRAWDAHIRATTNPRGLFPYESKIHRGMGREMPSSWPPGFMPPVGSGVGAVLRMH